MSGEAKCWLVTAKLSTPLAGDAPHLDAILERENAMRLGMIRELKNGAVEPWKVMRELPAPPLAAIPISIVRQKVGPWPVACCSSPILGHVTAETVDHYHSRYPAEEAVLLSESERRVVATTNSWTKSYRLPLRKRTVDRVCWICKGNRRGIRKTLKNLRAIGKKTSQGHGRVAEWTVESYPEDHTWLAMHESGPVLMRPLPAEFCPTNVVGARRAFATVCPPYWHPDRYCEAMVPC